MKRKISRNLIKKVEEQDLNKLIIKDSHGIKLLRQIVYSRKIFICLLILAQLVFIGFFIAKFYQHIEIYFGSSILLSAVFLIYLSNSKGRNEFKIAWVLPLVIFPFFGIAAYFLCHTDKGERVIEKKVTKIRTETNALLPSSEKESGITLLQKNPDIADLGTYLLNQHFYPYENTKIDYFPCGEQFYPDFLENLKTAKKFIFIESFIINVDESWNGILEILEQKAKEGVEVRVLYDGFGSVMASTKSYLNYLASKNIRAQIFTPLVPLLSTPLNNRDHRKIYIIDGEIAYTGGLNIANEYFNIGKNRFKYWKDNIIKLQGPAVKSLITLFMQTWNIGEKTTDNYDIYMNQPYKQFQEEGLVIPYGDDAYNNEDTAENIYLYMINSAKNYLHITSPYVLLDNTFLRSLIFAAKKGIDVKIVVPDVPDHLITFCIGKTFLKELCENGVKVYLYKKGFVHQKTFISDNKIATVGSVNLDYRSFYHHFECGVVIYNSPAVLTIEKDFNNILKDCVEMKKDDYKKLSIFTRLLGRIFRIFAPLM